MRGGAIMPSGSFHLKEEVSMCHRKFMSPKVYVEESFHLKEEAAMCDRKSSHISLGSGEGGSSSG